MDADPTSHYQDVADASLGIEVITNEEEAPDASENNAPQQENLEQPPKPKTEPVKTMSVSESIEKRNENDAKKEEAPPSPQSLPLNATSITSLSSHDRSRTVAAVAQIYEKGDQPATDRNEIWAWYCYDWANSPFAGAFMALLLPLLLSDLAEEYACSDTKYGCDINAHDNETGKLVEVYVGAWELKATSYAAFMIGLASLIQAIIYLFVGPLADYGAYRTLLFRITCISASIVTCFYLFLGDKSLWQFAGWWCILASVLHGLSIIFYNSWLPIIVETHPDVITACGEHLSEDKLKHMIQHKMDKLSLIGFAWGYGGAIVVMIICLALVALEPASYTSDLVEYGSNAAFVGSRDTFEELYARDVTLARINYTVGAQFVYIDGLQFVYDGLEGDLRGIPTVDATVRKQKSYAFPKSVDQVQIYRSVDYDHICGLSFHAIGDDADAYSSVGNTTVIADVIVMDEVLEEYMVFGGVSGTVAELKEDLANEISTSDTIYAISSLSILFVHKDGQFSAGENGQSSTRNERIGILINGLWLLAFGCVSIKYLKDRPGPPLPEGEKLYFFGLKQTIITLRKAKEFPVLFVYLVAYFIFSDGIGTLISCGTLFGRQLLHMSNTQLAIMVLEVYVIGTLGTYLGLKVAEKWNIESQKMLCFNLAFLTIVNFWPLFGLFPDATFGIVSASEMYVWIFFVGLNIGSAQSFARSVFGQIIPVGHESEMFALFEITDKGSSWMGPLVVSIVSDAGNMRWASIYVILAFLLSLPAVWMMDMDKGRFEAGRSPLQVTQRASMLFSADMIKELKEDLADVIEAEQDSEKQKEEKKGNETVEALEMVIDKNLTMTEDVFTDEENAGP